MRLWKIGRFMNESERKNGKGNRDRRRGSMCIQGQGIRIKQRLLYGKGSDKVAKPMAP